MSDQTVDAGETRGPAAQTAWWWPIAATGLMSTAIVLGTFAVYGTGEQGLQLAARYTVRDSFPLFLLAYTASAWALLAPSPATRWLMRNRRYLGLSFALAHFIHLGALTAFFVLTPAEADAAAVIGGGLAYLFIAAMAATSNSWSIAKLGRNWKRLHTVGLHYVWLIFLVTYAGRLSDPGMLPVGVIGVGLLFAALGLRLVARFQGRLQARR